MSLTKKTDSPLSPLLLDLEQNTALDGGVALLQPALDSLSSKDGIGGVLRGKQMGHAALRRSGRDQVISPPAARSMRSR